MKKNLVLISFVLLYLGVSAQSFNISMGVSMSSQERSEIQAGKIAPLLGFNSQFSRDFHIWKPVQLRAEIGFVQNGIKYLQPSYIEVFSYSQLGGFLMFKSIHSPVYLGLGGYGAYLMSVSGFSNGEAFLLNKKDYKFYDYGVESILGLSLDFNFIGYFVEMRFHYGLNNIARTPQPQIRNMSLNLTAGISLKIH